VIGKPKCPPYVVGRRSNGGFMSRGPLSGTLGPTGGPTMMPADRQWVELRRILRECRLLEDTGVPTCRCFPSAFYRKPTFCVLFLGLQHLRC